MHNPKTEPLLSPPPPYKPPPRHTESSTQLPAPTPRRSARPKPPMSLLDKLKELDETFKAYTPVLRNLLKFVLSAIAMGTFELVVVGGVVGVERFVLYLLFLGVKEAFRS